MFNTKDKSLVIMTFIAVNYFSRCTKSKICIRKPRTFFPKTTTSCTHLASITFPPFFDVVSFGRRERNVNVCVGFVRYYGLWVRMAGKCRWGDKLMLLMVCQILLIAVNNMMFLGHPFLNSGFRQVCTQHLLGEHLVSDNLITWY